MPDPTILIVVYKDELLSNLVKELIGSSISIVSLTEKMWLTKKAEGDISNYILFLGDIKGTSDLIPWLNIKFDRFGVAYGWSDKQAVVYIDNINSVKRSEDYIMFLKQLCAIPQLSTKIEKIVDKRKIATQIDTDDILPILEDEEISEDTNMELPEKGNMFAHIKGIVDDKLGQAHTSITEIRQDLMRNKKKVKQQMLCYGIANLCCHDLDEFLS